MINHNGNLLQDEDFYSDNRAFLYGDAVFETCKLVNHKVLFLEDHYFRLMASMRILRMKIPMDFTLEYFENQLIETAKSNNHTIARVRLTVYRNFGGKYTPATNTVSYCITSESLENASYKATQTQYEVDLYKDFYVTKQLLSTLKTTNRLINITGSIYAEENGLQNCVLLNNEKNVVEFLNGNLFLVFGNQIITTPINEGCLNGVMRKQLLKLIPKLGFELIERPISPFELQNADELFLTNVVQGVIAVSQYKKKTFAMAVSQRLIRKINEEFNLI